MYIKEAKRLKTTMNPIVTKKIKMKNRIALIFFLCSINLGWCQQETAYEPPKSKRFIDKLEAFGGFSINYPNDHGWSDFVFNSSNRLTIDKLQSKGGYAFGVSATHALGKRFELHGKFSFERREYSRSVTTLDVNGNIYGESFSDQKNDYLSFALIPMFFPFKSHRLHFFSGISYAQINQSLNVSTGLYIQGQSVGGIGGSVNTIDGANNVVDALVGMGYLFPFNNHFSCVLRMQGNYGLSYAFSQNKQNTSINSLSLSIAIRYSR